MSDFGGILRGTFILDQYHCWKDRAHFSPFHCCFSNIPPASDQTLLFIKEMPMSTFFRNALGNVVTVTVLLFFNLSYRVLWVRAYVWKYSCRLFYGAAGGSGAHCSYSPAFVLIGNKGGNPVAKGTVGQLNLVL